VIVRESDGTVFRGATHATIYAEHEGQLSPADFEDADLFETSTGRIVNSTEAAGIADAQAQRVTGMAEAPLVAEDLQPPTPAEAEAAERVTEVATRDLASGQVFTGASHMESTQAAWKALGREPKGSPWLRDEQVFEGLEQGFLTSEGRFVSREEAAKIAERAAQYKEAGYPKYDSMDLEVEKAQPPAPADAALAKAEGVIGIDEIRRHVSNPREAGFVEVKAVVETAKKLAEPIREVKDSAEEAIKALQFYPDAPPELRNAIRKDMIGGIDKAVSYVYDTVGEYLWGGLNKEEAKLATEIIYAKDQLSRRQLGKGNPNLTVEEAQAELEALQKRADPKVLRATERWTEVHQAYTDRLIERGHLDPDQLIPDHVRHYVSKYTPDFAPMARVPLRLKRYRRGYTRRAGETEMEYRQTQEALMQSLIEMEYDNLIDDFIAAQVAEYDYLPHLNAEERIELFGADKAGRATRPVPGKLYKIDDEWYRGYSPDAPFSRVIFTTEEGLKALGGHKNVSLLPEKIYDLFRQFSERGHPIVYRINKATAYWKMMAIYSHYPSFTLNNMVGDTWLALVQHPRPDAFLRECGTALDHLLGKRKDDEFMRGLNKWLIDQNIKWGFTRSEIGRFQIATHPVGAVLAKLNKATDARENFNRVAYAASLYRAMQQGNGRTMIDAHDWIDTKGLSESDALGKISREVLTDYSAVSKPWRRYISGMVAPFGTFYAKTSARVWKWLFKHPIKALSTMLSLPVAATLFNSRSKDIEELEAGLPDYIRNRTHFVLGTNPDGTTRVVSLQLPQDVLIGTKIFAIATDYANRVIDGEMPATEAAVETLKQWGIREVEGVAYLTGPWIRFFRGLKNRRDPYDKSPVYSMEVENLTWDRKLRDEALFFIKCSN
jgi:hypothetical protein